MAKDEQADEIEEIDKPKKKGIRLPILIGIILGVVILQAGIIFASIKFFAPAAPADPHAKDKKEKVDEEHAEDEEHATDEEEEDESGEKVVRKVEEIVKPENDLYINPRGNSNKLVILSFALEVAPPEKVKEVEEKLMVPIQDRIITMVSKFSAEELQDPAVRDSLRVLIKKDIKPYFVEDMKLRNVYFPKFVIQ